MRQKAGIFQFSNTYCVIISWSRDDQHGCATNTARACGRAATSCCRCELRSAKKQDQFSIRPSTIGYTAPSDGPVVVFEKSRWFLLPSMVLVVRGSSGTDVRLEPALVAGLGHVSDVVCVSSGLEGSSTTGASFMSTSSGGSWCAPSGSRSIFGRLATIRPMARLCPAPLWAARSRVPRHRLCSALGRSPFGCSTTSTRHFCACPIRAQTQAPAGNSESITTSARSWLRRLNRWNGLKQPSVFVVTVALIHDVGSHSPGLAPRKHARRKAISRRSERLGQPELRRGDLGPGRNDLS